MSPLLGLDYGKSRVGIAVSDETATLATAIATHRAGRDGSLFDTLRVLIADRSISGLVLGLPLTADGREAEMAVRVRAFARKLREEFELPVLFMDERYSSSEAAGYLHQGGRRRRHKEEIDAVAAEIILQRYLDGRRSGAEADDV